MVEGAVKAVEATAVAVGMVAVEATAVAVGTATVGAGTRGEAVHLTDTGGSKAGSSCVDVGFGLVGYFSYACSLGFLFGYLLP